MIDQRKGSELEKTVTDQHGGERNPCGFCEEFADAAVGTIGKHKATFGICSACVARTPDERKELLRMRVIKLQSYTGHLTALLRSHAEYGHIEKSRPVDTWVISPVRGSKAKQGPIAISDEAALPARLKKDEPYDGSPV